MLLTVLLIIGAVLWAVIGLLVVAASARNQGTAGAAGTILLVVVWLAGLAGFMGGAVRLMRPALQSMTSGLGKGHLDAPPRKRN
jgi:hypothetical protein